PASCRSLRGVVSVDGFRPCSRMRAEREGGKGRRSLRKSCSVAFEREAEAAAQEADRVVVADQRDRLEDLRFVEVRRERAPSRVAERVPLDQVVDQCDQGLLLGSPASGIRRAVYGRGDLSLAEADLAGEQRDMD